MDPFTSVDLALGISGGWPHVMGLHCGVTPDQEPLSVHNLEAFPHRMYPGLQWYVANELGKREKNETDI